MSSIVFITISLILISTMSSNAADIKKQMICETHSNYIDAVIDFPKYRYYVIGSTVYEYDFNHNFRRRINQVYDVEEYDLSDESRTPEDTKIESKSTHMQNKLNSNFELNQRADTSPVSTLNPLTVPRLPTI